jgi:hypothetical protein
MPQPRPNLTRVHLQDQILAKFGPEKIAEFRDRLCDGCAFVVLHGRPCALLPITFEGTDCPYHLSGEISLPGGNHNG